MVDASRQGALQGGIGSMNSVAAIAGPLLAAQSLAWGTTHGSDCAALIVAGGLTAAWRLLIWLPVPPGPYIPYTSPEPSTSTLSPFWPHPTHTRYRCI